MFQEMMAQSSLPSSKLDVALVGVFISFFGLLSWRRWKQKKTYQSLYSLPSPPRHWLLGNIPQVLAAVKDKKYFQLLFDWSQQLGPIYVCWRGSPLLILSQPKVIEETIVNGMRNGSLVRTQQTREAWNDISGPILLGEAGTQWQWRRKAWTPEFSSSGLSKYLEVIQVGCSQVIEKIRQTESSEAVEVDPLFVELTMSVIASLVLGIPVDQKHSSPEGPPSRSKKHTRRCQLSAIAFYGSQLVRKSGRNTCRLNLLEITGQPDDI